MRPEAIPKPASRRQEPEDYLLIAQGISSRLDGKSLRLEILFLRLAFGGVTRLRLSLVSQFLGFLLLGGGGRKQAVRLGLGFFGQLLVDGQLLAFLGGKLMLRQLGGAFLLKARKYRIGLLHQGQGRGKISGG